MASTVGPEATEPSGLPTTSDRISPSTRAGRASRASPPPFNCDNWVRTRLKS